MWAVEFYTPSQVEKLVDNFRRLEWHRSDRPGRESPAAWVQITRQLMEGGSWLSLGMIRSADDTRPWPRPDRTAPMPMYVRYAHGGLYALTPSLTCIVMCFVFEDSFRSRLDEVLRRHRQTFARPLRNGHEIFDPARQKTEEVRRVRQKCANLAATWFRENLPGVFSSGLLGDQVPTCELVTLQKAEPFPDPTGGDSTPPEYLRVLGLRFSPSVWRSADTPSLKLSFGAREQDLEYHSVFAIRDTDISHERLLEPYGGLPGLDTYVDSTFQEVIGKLAIEPLLDGYSRSLNRLRDTVTTEIRRSSRQSPSDTLRALVDNVAYDVDIAAVTADLVASAEESPGSFHDLARFEPCHEWQSQHSLADSFRSAVKRHATRLRQTDRSLRDHLTQFGSLIAATEDIRTQNRIFGLTVVVAVLTFWVAIMALATFLETQLGSALIGWLQDTWRRI